MQTDSYVPFFRHHHDPLHQEPLRELRPQALVQPQKPLMPADVQQHLGKTAEGSSSAAAAAAIVGRLPVGLEHGFGDDEGVGEDRGEDFGEGAEY